MDEREEGFTLIELLVVVIIIGILAAIAIPAFLNQRDSARRSTVESDLRNAAIAMETAATNNDGAYPTGAAGTAVGSLTYGSPAQTVDFNGTANVNVTLRSGTANEFCLAGDNTTLGGTGADVWYDSDAGGIVNAAC